MRRAALILLLVVARWAHADPAGHVADARRHFADLDFELVLDDAAAVVADPSALPAQRSEAMFLRGAALVVLDREADAASTFEALLTQDPAFTLPADTAPRIRATFEAARASRRVRLEEELATRDADKLRTVALVIDAPPSARGGTTLHLRAHITDPHHLVARLVFAYRRDPDLDYVVTTAPAAPVVDLAIPGAVLASERDYKLAWYVDALHPSGARVRHEGDDRSPRWISVSRGNVPEPQPITRRWWFWAGLATVAASAIAVPILIDRARDAGPQQIVVGGG